MKRVIPIVTSLVLSATATHVPAQGIGDSEKGLAVARNVCSECHAIRKEQARSPNSKAPTFAELATTPG
jgi:cytochrome c2